MAYMVHQSINTKIQEMIINGVSRRVALTAERKFHLFNKKDE